MDNITALRGLCNAIASTFYPDETTMELTLFNEDYNPNTLAQPKDPKLLRMAISLVKGYVEASRSESGVSASVNVDAIEASIKHWCKEYGLDAVDVLNDGVTISDGSDLW